MIKTEIMKRYESETGKQSAIVKFMAGGQALEQKSYPKLGPYDYGMDYIAWLEAQLTWRPVSEKLPSVEKDGNAVIARLKDLDEGLVQFDVVSTLWFIDNYESWYTHWLPIPPAQEV